MHCFPLKNRQELLTLLQSLPQAEVAETEEVLRVIEEARLHGRGVRCVDADLLSAALLSRSPVGTLERRLAAAARALRVST